MGWYTVGMPCADWQTLMASLQLVCTIEHAQPIRVGTTGIRGHVSNDEGRNRFWRAVTRIAHDGLRIHSGR